jgi:ribose 5-phosphate isomerase A
MARSAVARELLKLAASPAYRDGFMTDNGNIILDVYQLDLLQPEIMEVKINQIVGVVENGLFAKRKADEVFMATQAGIKHWCI